MGEVLVPVDAKWRAQTQRAVENFPISGEPMPVAVVHQLARIKAAAARVNAELGIVEPAVAEAVRAAAVDIAAGRHDAQFPIDVFQTGSGTSLQHEHQRGARHAGDASSSGVEVHPNDHVNASQSSATTPSRPRSTSPPPWPSSSDLHPGARAPGDVAGGQGRASSPTVVKSGRTHLMDATPVTLGQEFGGYAAQVALRRRARCTPTLPGVGELPLGGTAVGTGINTPPGFAARGHRASSPTTTGPAVHRGPRPLRGAGRAGRARRAVAAQLRIDRGGLTKICNDLRWMGSGPRTGLAEIRLPDLQPGSSIMPGKVNPVLPEATLMVVRPGHRQRRDRRVSPAPPAASSST